jgi:hypothetical protein
VAASKVMGFLVKWVVVPAIMVGVGFFFLGPQIGGAPILANTAEQVKTIAQTGGSNEPIDVPEEKGRFSNVKLEVDLTSDSKKKPASNSETKDKKYFSSDAGLPETPNRGSEEDTAMKPGEETTLGNDPAKAGGDTGGW